MDNQKQAALLIGMDGTIEFLMPLSIADVEQVVVQLQRHINQAKQQARFTPRQEVVAASENGNEAD